ncbi:ATP-binding protein [Runella sp.]|uniref:ATP-binding protein n=1 Tax=Runella sp. TaxID=1960881 RepID=UPI003D14B54C
MKRFLLYVLFSFGYVGSVVAQVILSDTLSTYPLTSKTELFEDKTAALSFEQVQKLPFTPFRKPKFLFPFSTSVFWVKIALKNVDPHQKAWMLVWDNPVGESIDFYVPNTKGVYQVSRQGIVGEERKDKLSENLPHVRVFMDLNEQKTIYIRVKSQKGFYSTVRAKTLDVYTEDKLTSNTREGFFSGLVLIRLFYVLLLAVFAVRELTFRLYTLVLIIRSLSFWGLMGIFGNFLSGTPLAAVTVTFLSFHFIPIGQALFAKDILPIKRFHPAVRFAMNMVLILTAILGVLIAFNYRWYWLLASTYVGIFGQLLTFGMYIAAVIRRYSINWYYSVPFLLGNVSYTLMQMRLVGWLDHPLIIAFVSLCFIGEIFVFGIFLGRIIISHEKARADSEKQLRFNLEQTTKLQELDTLKTRFFANISHEFRTPLTLLVGPLTDLKKKYPQEGIIPLMQRNLGRLQTLINQLLDLSKLEAGKMEPHIQKGDLSQYLNQLFASFESLAQSKKIIFQHEQGKLPQEAYYDADKLEKIITNLLSNAFKFTPTGGRIHVRADYNERRFTLQIKDWGIGIAAERLPLIFDRFYQADTGNRRDYEGTGIGLALVKELVEVLRGHITVESQVGQGTVFTVKIPYDQATWQQHLIPDPESKEINREQIAFEITKEKEVVAQNLQNELPILLIVEDNSDLRSYISGIFEGIYQVAEAQDGQEGLEKAIEQIPDVVICDLMMPRLDGFGFCKALKTDIRTNHIPVVMLTAKATLEDRLEGFELGADDYLSKPFNTEELQARVRNLVAQRQALRQKYAQPLVLNVTESVKAEPKEATIDEQFLQKVNAVIERFVADSQFDVETFAAEVGMTSVQLRRKLKALMGQTVTEYIRNYRLEKAAELLRKKAGTVSEIAYRVGFESLSYFSKVFVEKYGVSPSEYIVNP